MSTNTSLRDQQCAWNQKFCRPVLHFCPPVARHRRSSPLKNEEAADEFRLPKTELPVAQSGQQASILKEFESRGHTFSSLLACCSRCGNERRFAFAWSRSASSKSVYPRNMTPARCGKVEHGIDQAESEFAPLAHCRINVHPRHLLWSRLSAKNRRELQTTTERARPSIVEATCHKHRHVSVPPATCPFRIFVTGCLQGAKRDRRRGKSARNGGQWIRVGLS